MLVIGVTGGIGSGKTEVCKMFANFGATVIYADALAREIMETNTALRKKLKHVFGENIYTSQGKLHRTQLANIVFRDKQLKEKLDAAVHPYVLKELQDVIRKEVTAKHDDLLFIEAALIYESGADDLMDYVVVVDADEEARIRRVMHRDSATRDEVLRRGQAQMPRGKKVQKADFVIQNDGDLKSLESKVQFLYKLFSKITES